MTRRSRRFLLPGLVLLPAIAAYAGGWATITVADLPDYVVARQPVNLTFTVRQHGKTRVTGLNPRVEAQAGRLETATAATPEREPGQYTATLTLPRPGEWTITIHSGFGNSRVTLLPLTAVDSGGRLPRPLAEAERGRRLFVAKGCVGCHLHKDVDGSGKYAVGPELTGRRFPADYLTQFLADPAGTRPPPSGAVGMPDLDLGPAEIAALVSFINTERQALR